MKILISNIYIVLSLFLYSSCKSQNNIEFNFNTNDSIVRIDSIIPVKALTQDSLITTLKVHTIKIIDGYKNSNLKIFTTLVYDKDGKLVEREQVNQQLAEKTTFIYNNKNLLIGESTIETMPKHSGLESTVEYEYNSNNRLLRKKTVYNNPQSITEKIYKYNKLGLLDTLIDEFMGNPVKIIYEYNSIGLCIKETKKPLNEPAFEVDYIYNINGWETEKITPNQNFKKEYNNKGQKIKTHYRSNLFGELHESSFDEYKYYKNGLLRESLTNEKKDDKWEINEIQKCYYTFY
ncbi:MAG TPA: hypothetical protein PK772_03745 [Chitinophagaceae bacterium]|nr:hypothetical protein [Chitinophagaceae bacterium]